MPDIKRAANSNKSAITSKHRQKQHRCLSRSVLPCVRLSLMMMVVVLVVAATSGLHKAWRSGHSRSLSPFRPPLSISDAVATSVIGARGRSSSRSVRSRTTNAARVFSHAPARCPQPRGEREDAPRSEHRSSCSPLSYTYSALFVLRIFLKSPIQLLRTDKN